MRVHGVDGIPWGRQAMIMDDRFFIILGVERSLRELFGSHLQRAESMAQQIRSKSITQVARKQKEAVETLKVKMKRPFIHLFSSLQTRREVQC